MGWLASVWFLNFFKGLNANLETLLLDSEISHYLEIPELMFVSFTYFLQDTGIL